MGVPSAQSAFATHSRASHLLATHEKPSEHGAGESKPIDAQSTDDVQQRSGFLRVQPVNVRPQTAISASTSYANPVLTSSLPYASSAVRLHEEAQQRQFTVMLPVKLCGPQWKP